MYKKYKKISIFFKKQTALVTQTETQYRRVIAQCKALFDKKNQDYGPAWRILRLPSITDQIFIKAQRIRSIQDKGTQKIGDSIASEFVGIINYCIMALIQNELGVSDQADLSAAQLSQRYDEQVEATVQLLANKNHDYGEAWRSMRVSSMTDLILMKIFRTKQIEDNQGKTLVSEGVEANYQDMLNYAVFCLIILEENSENE
jgi:transcription initiation factor TFIIIB Brf1 subunit/transcription initiation factor TFIIB